MSNPPSTPHLSQLAFQLSQEGRHEQALDLLKRANQSEPTNPYLAVNLGYCAMAAGQSLEASAAFERAEALFSSDQLQTVPILDRLCQGYLLSGKAERAQQLLHAHAPLGGATNDPIIALHASVSVALGEAEQALLLFGRLTAPESRDQLSATLSSLLIRQGRLADAEHVLVQSPGTSTRADLITNLAILASEHGKISRARGFYLQALELEPDSFVPAFNLARFYFLQGDSDRAQHVITRALNLVPQAKEGYQLLEQIESGRGDFDAALSVVERWQRLDPNDLSAQLAECRILATNGGHDRLTSLLPTLLSRCPGHPDLLALLAGLPRELRAQQGLNAAQVSCFEPDRQVQLHPGVLSQALCQSLEALILEDPTLHADRPHKPSRQGAQTHELFAEPLSTPLQDLVEVITPHLETLVRSFTSEQRLAFAYPASSQSLRFSGWGVVLQSGGYQAPHAHPESLFSGVVYLRVPRFEQVDSDQLHQPGSICFYGNGVQTSTGMESTSQAHQSATFTFAPAAGDLILFPSFLWHGTVPFVADEQRICLAFNLLPRIEAP